MLHSALSSVMLIVDPAEEEVARFFRKQKSELIKLLKKPDEVVWEYVVNQTQAASSKRRRRMSGSSMDAETIKVRQTGIRSDRLPLLPIPFRCPLPVHLYGWHATPPPLVPSWVACRFESTPSTLIGSTTHGWS